MSFKKIICLLLGVFMLALAGCGGNEKKQASVENAYMQLTDAAGRHVVIVNKPERVVTLTPSYLSMIDAVGGTIVGRATSRVGVIPPSMEKVPEVGFVYNINMEALIGLKPDLVLAGRNQHDKFTPILESNNINVIQFDAKTYEDVKSTVMVLGNVYGTQDKAKAECELLDKEIKAITDKLPAEKSKKKIVIMHATASSVTVEGKKSIAGCVSDILGFDNVAATALGSKSEKTPYSMESLVGQNPEIIFITSMGKADEIENRLRADFKNNPAWNSLEAVQKGKVYVLPERLFLINPGLNYPEAVEYMAKQVYPEVFKDGK